VQINAPLSRRLRLVEPFPGAGGLTNGACGGISTAIHRHPCSTRRIGIAPVDVELAKEALPTLSH
jgi:hypothetical protein